MTTTNPTTNPATAQPAPHQNASGNQPTQAQRDAKQTGRGAGGAHDEPVTLDPTKPSDTAAKPGEQQRASAIPLAAGRDEGTASQRPTP